MLNRKNIDKIAFNLSNLNYKDDVYLLYRIINQAMILNVSINLIR